ncbi:hypothetical protein GCM10010468_36700 [Actinocorallia longicatena]|uniref:Aspartyl protease n=1 Tax=Actinocorallia longicatena TaxID=111803 RepID=A0ABP6QBB9_9ACTN
MIAAVLAVALSGCTMVESVDPAADPAPAPQQTRRGETSIPVKVVTRGGGTVVKVPVRIGGRGPYEFILDTGASISALDKRLVAKLGLAETGETAQVTGVTGAAELPLVSIPKWTLAGHTLHADALPVIDLAGSGSGLLGADELRRFGAIRIDFAGKRLVLRDR